MAMTRLTACLASIVVLAGLRPLEAGFFCEHGGCKPACAGCSVRWVCCPSYEKVKVEKDCFDVECEHICVPKVKFPWQDCCTPRRAYVIGVHRLKKVKIDCGEKCVINWEAKPVYTRCCKPGYTRSPAAGCGPAPCAVPGEYHVPGAGAAPLPVPAGDLPAPPAP